MYERPAARLFACLLVLCLSATVGRADPGGLPQQDERPLDELRSSLVAAKTISDALPHALDLVRHAEVERAQAAAIELLEKRGLAAQAVLNAMRHHRTAWPSAVPSVMLILGNGSESLIEPAARLVQVWAADEKKAGTPHVCLSAIRKRVRDAVSATGPLSLRDERVLRGAIAVMRLQERVEDIRPLIDLVKLDVRRETKSRVVNALEAITGNRLAGWEWAAWAAWANAVFEKGAPTLVEIRQRSIDSTREAADRFALEELATINALGTTDLARFARYLKLPSENVAATAADRIADLYAGVTGETERYEIQLIALPVLIHATKTHRDRVVLSAINAIGKLAKPAVKEDAILQKVRQALLQLVADGTPKMQSGAVVALEDYAPPEGAPRDEKTSASLRKIFEALEPTSSMRARMITTIAAYGGDEAAKLFMTLLESDAEVDAVRVSAAKGALSNGHAAEAIEVVSNLMRAAAEKTLPLRRQLVLVLGNIVIKHPEATEVLAERLESDADLVIRTSAAQSLGYVQSEKFRDQAAAALHRPLANGGETLDEKLAAALARSLGRHGHVLAGPDLIALLKKHPTGDLRDAIASSLVEIAYAKPARAAEGLDRLLAQGYYEIAASAYTALATRDGGKRLQELPPKQRDVIRLRGIDALIGTDTEANLITALEVAQNLVSLDDKNAAFALANARVLHRLGAGKKPERAEAILALLANVPRDGADSVAKRERIVIEGWARLAKNQVAAARAAFQGLAAVEWKAARPATSDNGNGASSGASPEPGAPSPPAATPASTNGTTTAKPPSLREQAVYWEYCVGHAIALTTAGKGTPVAKPGVELARVLVQRVADQKKAVDARGSRMLRAAFVAISAKLAAAAKPGEKKGTGASGNAGERKPTPRKKPKPVDRADDRG